MGLSPLPAISEFFRLEVIYSSAYLMHNACNGRMLSPKTEQICLGSFLAPVSVPSPLYPRLVHEPDHLRVSSGWANSNCDF